MLFRIESHVRLRVSEGDTLQLRFDGDHDISVSFRKEFHYVEETGDEFDYLNVTAQGAWDLESNMEAVFHYLASNELPPEYGPPLRWVKAERQEFGRVVRSQEFAPGGFPGYVPSSRDLPESVKTVIRTVEKELVKMSRDAVNLVSWRFGVRGPHEPLTYSLFQWSQNGGSWKLVPFELDPRQHVEKFPYDAYFLEPTQDGLQSLIQTGKSEPLGHSLWREAWGHRELSPRSALVIGVAAAEVGIKQFSSEIAPSTAYLLEEGPSPSLEKLLRHHLPKILEDKQRFPIKQVPTTIIKSIKKAVENRNAVVHKSPTAQEKHQELQDWLSADDLETALLAVSDLLWFLDYYRGFEWALDHVRKETLADWKASGQ